MGVVTAASHVAVSRLGAGSGSSVRAVTLAAVLGSRVFVTQTLAGGCTLEGSVVASGTGRVAQSARASVNEASVGGEASGKRDCGGR